RKVTNKVDIWALGCILYEISSKRQLFRNDLAVLQFLMSPDSKVEVSGFLVPESVQSHLTYCLSEMLMKDPEQRPKLSTLKPLFESYCDIWDSSAISLLDDESSFPPYSQWKEITQYRRQGIGHFISSLVDWYESDEKFHIVNQILEAFPKIIPNEVGKGML